MNSLIRIVLRYDASAGRFSAHGADPADIVDVVRFPEFSDCHRVYSASCPIKRQRFPLDEIAVDDTGQNDGRPPQAPGGEPLVQDEEGRGAGEDGLRAVDEGNKAGRDVRQRGVLQPVREGGAKDRKLEDHQPCGRADGGEVRAPFEQERAENREHGGHGDLSKGNGEG